MIDGLIDIELPDDADRVPIARTGTRRAAAACTVARLAAVVPAPIEQRQIGGGTFHVLRLATTMLPESVRDELDGGLVSLGMDQEAGTRFYRWFYGLRLALAVGLRDDYLMVSIGPDTRLLERLGVEGLSGGRAGVGAGAGRRAAGYHGVGLRLSGVERESADAARTRGLRRWAL